MKRKLSPSVYDLAIYKNRNTEAIIGMRETSGMGGMKYFRECLQAFHEISSNNTGNVLKHSGECTETFQGMSPSILRNGSKHYGECRYPMNFARHSGKCFQTFWGMSALLKKMKAQGQSKISCCCFSVWVILRELGSRRVQDSLV